MSTVLDLFDLGYEMVPREQRKKGTPLKGTTGYRGVALTRDVVAAYAAMTTTPRGWAIRHGALSVGVDVDAYKDDGAALLNLVELYGPLPRTVMSTARSDGMSGIRFFRLSEPTYLKGNPAASIEMIQRHHRFSIVAPSTHPKLGDPYRFLDSETGDVVDLPPAPGDLPLLPDTWVAGLKSSNQDNRDAAESATSDEIKTFVDAHTDARAPGLLRKLEARLEQAGVGSRHDTLLSVACWTMREAAAGLYAANDALTLIEGWWAEVMDDADRREGTELPLAVAFAIGQADDERVALVRQRFENWVQTDIKRKRDEMKAWIRECSQ